MYIVFRDTNFRVSSLKAYPPTICFRASEALFGCVGEFSEQFRKFIAGGVGYLCVRQCAQG